MNIKLSEIRNTHFADITCLSVLDRHLLHIPLSAPCDCLYFSTPWKWTMDTYRILWTSALDQLHAAAALSSVFT